MNHGICKDRDPLSIRLVVERPRITVRRSMWNGKEGSPKNGKLRVVPLTRETVIALRALQHLRGRYVFCHEDGRPFTHSEVKDVVPNACRGAGLAKRLTTHGLRHTYASHLVMRISRWWRGTRICRPTSRTQRSRCSTRRQGGATDGQRGREYMKKPRGFRGFEEREKGFEPSTLALARRCSTTELFPQDVSPRLLPTAAPEGQAARPAGARPRRGR